MDRIVPVFKCVVAALFLWAANFSVSYAQDSETAALLDKLRDPDLTNWEEVEQSIWQRWSESGSPTADLLLERGRKAMESEDWPLAIDHLTALIDHVPDFAEGYNARATAYYQADLLGPAMNDIEATLALNPDHFGALMGLGLILEKVGLDEGALSAYRAVAAIHPHRPNLKDAIERLERNLGDATL
ncbi:tetratricopeptide repeat protein [Meridianimarinicoccus aquatilis]|uniref:Tetratricopeptide repeat protein n=1 Tax=Meridianimarinicoccus aquatilis TaxID=2552766 RepID=A0A4R6B5I9_9RHOB|nr:tetratricopeptide repeat protein [Fluviibacterium aquatile]